MPRILIVDDSVSMRRLVGFTLRQGGYEVIEALNGQDALNKLPDKAFDLVITDLYMPVMDGITLARNLRLRAEFRDKPILMLTIESQSVNEDQGIAAGVTEWILKPFDPEELLQKIARVLP